MVVVCCCGVDVKEMKCVLLLRGADYFQEISSVVFFLSALWFALGSIYVTFYPILAALLLCNDLRSFNVVWMYRSFESPSQKIISANLHQYYFTLTSYVLPFSWYCWKNPISGVFFWYAVRSTFLLFYRKQTVLNFSILKV